MSSYGLLTNPSIEIISEISKIYDLNFDYAEIGIECPEGNPDIINKKRHEIVKSGIDYFAMIKALIPNAYVS